jgi:hypothetical protein
VLAQAGGPDPDMREEERPRAGSPGVGRPGDPAQS